MKRMWIAGLVGVLLASAALAVGEVAAYKGNVKSKVFHQTSCKYYGCKNCTAEFASRRAATKAGFRPCKVCKP